MNVPMDEMRQIVDNAIENGYAVAWAADVSEGGFKWKEGYAIIPAEVDEANMTDSEISRWVQLDDNARVSRRKARRRRLKLPRRCARSISTTGRRPTTTAW